MKALFRKLLRATLGAPTPWLAAGVALLCVSLAFSYHRSQVEAEYALALRLGAPEPVAIAEADPGQTGEGHIIAAFDPERATPISLDGPGNEGRWLAVPLFAASGDDASAQAPIRPRPRPETVSEAPLEVFGLALFRPGARGPESLLAEGSEAFSGALNGLMIPSQIIGAEARAGLAASGIALPATFPVIEPWVDGRAVALAPEARSPLATYLFWCGIASVLTAIGLSVWPEQPDRYLNIPQSEPERRIVTKSRVKSDAHRFNPLVGQDDIRRGAMERLAAAERAQGRTPSSFYTNTPAGKVGAGWVKNRR